MTLLTRPTNEQILAARIAARDRIPGPRVGDFLRLPRIDDRQPEFTRLTHLWSFGDPDDNAQTGGGKNGSYYLAEGGGLSYSGGLDPGVKIADLLPTPDTMEGRIWFFDRDYAGAGRGMNFMIPCRIFDLRPGAETRGLHDLNTGYHVGYHPAGSPMGYKWTVTRFGTPQCAFHHLAELEAWAREANFKLRPLMTEGNYAVDWPGA